MAKLEIASILLDLGGDGNNQVPKYEVTAAEVAVLRLLHGEQAVHDIKIIGTKDFTDRQEIARLQGIYVRREGERLITSEVNSLYPGAGARVPYKFVDLELPDELFAVKEREAPKADDEDETVGDDGEKPLDKMSLKELQAHASKYSDLDLNGITKKDDVRAAIELYEETHGSTDSVFE